MTKWLTGPRTTFQCGRDNTQAIRSASVSPRRSPTRLPNSATFTINSSFSQLIGSLDYQAFEEAGVVDSIPKKEWRLLAALARKRQENDERDRLADEFRRLWQKEEKERKLLEAQSTEQYKKYIQRRREDERRWHDLRKTHLISEQRTKTGHLIDCIKYKDMRSQDVLAEHQDKKVTDTINKSLDFQARMLLAAERRMRQGASQKLRKELELYEVENKVEEARRRRNAMLKDASHRVAISNVLTSWESALLREEVEAMEAARRAHHAAHAALTDAKSARLARSRDMRVRRAREIAQFAAQLRDSVRGIRR